MSYIIDYIIDYIRSVLLLAFFLGFIGTITLLLLFFPWLVLCRFLSDIIPYIFTCCLYKLHFKKYKFCECYTFLSNIILKYFEKCADFDHSRAFFSVCEIKNTRQFVRYTSFSFLFVCCFSPFLFMFFFLFFFFLQKFTRIAPFTN